MLGLTKDEKLVIIFLSASLAAGSALLLYKRHHPGFAPGLGTAAGGLPSPLADTLSCAHSDSVLLPGETAGAAAPPRKPVPVGPVNINTAGQKALERLPYIGPSMAKKIIEYRSSAGGFTSVEQLGRVKGIGPKRLEQLRRHVTVDK
jgi:competence protein ComEA